MTGKLIIPRNPVKFHNQLLEISFKHHFEIKDFFKPIYNVGGIHHLSVNIVNPAGEIVFFSATPTTGFNVCSSNLWRGDFSISPKIYKNKNFYWWDKCYHPTLRDKIIKAKEIPHNFKCGFVFVKKVNDFYLLYSFASMYKKDYISKLILNDHKQYYRMGDFAYQRICSSYAQYANGYTPPSLYDAMIKEASFADLLREINLAECNEVEII